jgi:hypothetical protein
MLTCKSQDSKPSLYLIIFLIQKFSLNFDWI